MTLWTKLVNFIITTYMKKIYNYLTIETLSKEEYQKYAHELMVSRLRLVQVASDDMDHTLILTQINRNNSLSYKQ